MYIFVCNASNFSINVLTYIINQYSHSMHKDTLVVSCYYQLHKSKHSHEKYQQWMKNMLENVQNNMFVFVGDKHNETYVRSLRGSLPIQTLVLPFTELKMYQYMNIWNIQWKNLDPEKNIHNPNLYIIWNEKIEFLAKAKQMTETKYVWYMWMDIGSFRCEHGHVTANDISCWLRDDIVNARLSKTKFNMLQIDEFRSTQKEIDDISLLSRLDFKNKLNNTGGTYIIPSDSIELWHERFYSLIEKYITVERFAGKDQNILANLLIAYPEHVNVVYSQKGCACAGHYNQWFYWQYVLHPHVAKPVWVTVLIPLYNKNNDIRYLKECLESVYAQTYPMYNIVIGVNGEDKPIAQHTLYMSICTSITESVMKRESFKVIVKWYTTKGKPDTMNAMVQDAVIPESLDYDHRIAILDVDDLWLPEKLALQVHVIHLFQDKYDVIGTSCNFFGKNVKTTTPNLPYTDVTNYDFFLNNPIINSSALIRKADAVWQDRFNLDDYFMWMQLKHEKKRQFYNIEHVLVMHRIRNDSSFNASGNQQVSELREYWRHRISRS